MAEKENKRTEEMQDIQETTELLKQLPEEKRKEIYFVVKGVALAVNSQTVMARQTA